MLSTFSTPCVSGAWEGRTWGHGLRCAQRPLALSKKLLVWISMACRHLQPWVQGTPPEVRPTEVADKALRFMPPMSWRRGRSLSPESEGGGVSEPWQPPNVDLEHLQGCGPAPWCGHQAPISQWDLGRGTNPENNSALASSLLNFGQWLRLGCTHLCVWSAYSFQTVCKCGSRHRSPPLGWPSAVVGPWSGAQLFI